LEAPPRCLPALHRQHDFIACLIVQEIMLESFAVASYFRVGKVAPGSLGKTFARIAAEEEDHVDHAMSILRAERARDALRFDDKVYRLHLDVMTTLAQMLAIGMQRRPLRSLPRHLREATTLRRQLVRSRVRAPRCNNISRRSTCSHTREVTLSWVTQLPV